jgi:CheY-like chemotaxis protein
MNREAQEVNAVSNVNARESKERNTGLHFLIVEDNPGNVQALKDYLNQRGDELTRITADIVPDYDGAEEHLEKGGYNAVITDLLFPKKTGSNDVSLGLGIVAEIEELAGQPDFKGRIEDSGAKTAFDKDLESLKKALNLPDDYKSNTENTNTIVGLKGQPSANNQPLGVLVTEKAKQQNIPYAIVTSGHGTHGDITTPVAVLLKEKGLIQSVRGNVAGEQRPGTGRTMAKYVRNGQFLSLDEFTAARTAEGNEQDIQEMTQDYEARKTRFDASLRQPLFTCHKMDGVRCKEGWRKKFDCCATSSNLTAKIIYQINQVSKNGRILLANLLQSSKSTFPCVCFPSFFAFKEGMWDTQISALLSSPTVSVRFVQSMMMSIPNSYLTAF